jgi:hypothetical protein
MRVNEGTNGHWFLSSIEWLGPIARKGQNKADTCPGGVIGVVQGKASLHAGHPGLRA